MAEKKTAKTKKTIVKKPTVTKKAKTKSKSKSKNSNAESFGDGGIVIVDDDLVVDQEKINEERRAYLEEAKSQEASD